MNDETDESYEQRLYEQQMDAERAVETRFNFWAVVGLLAFVVTIAVSMC
jgi:hypothetical protein